MNFNDERFLYCPELPQYGRQLTCCRVGLVQGLGVLNHCILFFICSAVVGITVGMGKKYFPAAGGVQTASVLVGSGLAIGVWMVLARFLREIPKQALFVFEGGVHLNESVRYLVPNGHLIEFRRGIRQVSLPWRVLKNLQIKEHRKGGEQFDASLRIPDGRILQITTTDGPESIVAIQAIAQKLSP